MRPETPLDSVVFELDETRARCELWISAGDATERLASGFVMPFISHLQQAQIQEQLESGAEHIRLQAPPCPVVHGTPWFTKKTIERFVRFVSTPDVLERVSFLERERIKLAEATGILLAKSPQMPSVSPLAANADASQGESRNQNSMESLETEAESSRKHLASAMDARRLALEKEQQKGFARASAAGFSIDSLRELIAFADEFGATRLREACLQFSSLHSRLQETEELQRRAAAKEQELDSSPEPNQAGGVKNFGRRRVWGPPVAAIPLQNGGVRGSDGLKLNICSNGDEGEDGDEDEEEQEVDGALKASGDGDDSRLKSNPCSSSSSGESDWGDDTETSSRNPIYDNVIGQLERLHLSHREDDAPKACEAPAPATALAPVVRRKGIIVIRNKDSHQPEVKKPESEEDDDEDGENEGGRLSVRAAISLFETKQKLSSSDAKLARRSVPESIEVKQKQISSKTGDSQSKAPVKVEEKSKIGSLAGVKKDAGLPKLRASEVGSPAIVPHSAADEISKELLDKSYSCLLKINSVVQDALLSASALQQATQRAELKLNATVDAENGELRKSPQAPQVAALGNGELRKAPQAVQVASAMVEERHLVSQRPVPKPAPTAEVSHHEKGRLYDQYQERREAKYKRESSTMKAEREAKLRAMQEVLERRKTELLGRSSRLFEKNSTLTAEQMKTLKLQANSRPNTLKTENRTEKPATTRKPSLPSRATQKLDSPTSKSVITSARKTSPKAPPLAQKTGRLNSSPRSKLAGAPVSQRRMPNFLSQSVITESLHAPADVRKENAKPPPRRSNLNLNLNPHSYQHESKQSSSNSSRSLLESNRVATGGATETNRRTRATVRKAGSRVSDDEILVPLKIARDIAAEQDNFAAPATKIPRATRVSQRVIPEEQQQQVSDTEAAPAPGSGSKSGDECIKQIVSCNKSSSKDRPIEQSPSSVELEDDAGSSKCQEKGNCEPEPELELESYVKSECSSKKAGVYEFDDSEMQIDDAVEKCMSGRSFLEGISASPLINNFGLPKKSDHPRVESFKQELSSSLRTGPSSQSLPHLPRSLSPPSFRTADFSKEPGRGICREHHQPAPQKDQPKGLKRLLKFGRKHRASDSNLTEWSTINEDLRSETKAPVKKSEDNNSSRSSGVRRSLEALPKIADVASELFSRNLFSSFRSKSSASSDSRA